MRGGTRCSMYSYDCSALWKYTAALYRPRLRSGRHYGLRGAGRKCCTRPEVDDERPGRPESPVGPVSTKILPVAVCLSNSDGQTLRPYYKCLEQLSSDTVEFGTLRSFKRTMLVDFSQFLKCFNHKFHLRVYCLYIGICLRVCVCVCVYGQL